jgi:hypothetical protein
MHASIPVSFRSERGSDGRCVRWVPRGVEVGSFGKRAVFRDPLKPCQDAHCTIWHQLSECFGPACIDACALIHAYFELARQAACCRSNMLASSTFLRDEVELVLGVDVEFMIRARCTSTWLEMRIRSHSSCISRFDKSCISRSH